MKIEECDHCHALDCHGMKFYKLFVNQNKIWTPSILGKPSSIDRCGLSIGCEVLIYSWKVMRTMGMRIVPMDAYSAFVSELSEAITVHILTQVRVPVSTSQAIVGAVVGVDIIRDAKTVRKRMLAEIGFGWISPSPFRPHILWYYQDLAGNSLRLGEDSSLS